MMDDLDGGGPLCGGCTCRRVRYRVEVAPMFVHCCHCSWCQRETDSAFAVNALIEAAQVTLLTGEVASGTIASASGRGQRVSRCPDCLVILWSTYPDAGPAVRSLRAGTLDRPARIRPDIHIYTSTRLPWVELAPQPRVVPAFYAPKAVWPAKSLSRYRAARTATTQQT